MDLYSSEVRSLNSQDLGARGCVLIEIAPVLARCSADIHFFASTTVVLTRRLPLEVSPMKLSGVSLVGTAAPMAK